ncbi:SIR2 family protein [Thalassospira sp. A3_1]|uniref:SIR2 family protein n=1 Tax=Thalassospira sp. A3_1 TaxID=2821088 RepID=UPI001ADAEF90|nr:SIR2 family protein [Thalassospira sp. A3_1]MBO9507494.1 SIR2 family protein [Thalassospira sp. A3_1]
MSGKVTLFAGAGISTESKNVLPYSLFEKIRSQLGLEDEELSFPEVMQRFCQKPNGRIKLLQEVRDRFKNVDAFPEIQGCATRFHKETGTLFTISNIVTTNWDSYFEQFSHATPFVLDQDLAFWEVAERRVLKIHGSIENLSTIVATEDDYKARAESLGKGLIGGLLKTLLATQTFIFVGYSLRDSDFQELYGFVKKQMADFHRQAYVVTPFEDEAEKFLKDGLIPIVTDGTYFIELLKERAIEEGILIPDEHYLSSANNLYEFLEEHDNACKNVKPSVHPQIIYSLTYQDGVIHALQRIMKMRFSGEYSNFARVCSLVEKYEQILLENEEHNNFSNVAYITGYINGLVSHLEAGDEGVKIPKYFAFDCERELLLLDDFLDFVTNNPDAHPQSMRVAKHHLSDLEDADSVVFHHSPWL